MGKTISLAGLVCWLCLILPAGCTVGPEYRRPETVAGQAGSYRNAPESLARVVAEDDFSRWWVRMEDPLMVDYVDRLLTDNLQLMEAAARINQAYALLGIESGSRLPSLAVTGSASRRFQSLENVGVTSGIPIPGGSGEERFYITQLEAGLSTSWQVDLFGKVSQRIASARSQYLASRVEAKALVHSLISELARRRVQWPPWGVASN